MNLDDIKMATTNDKTLEKAIELTRNGCWYTVKTISDPDIDRTVIVS